MMRIDKLVITRNIAASAKRIWHVMSTPGHLEYCHPFCVQNVVNKWPGKGSFDEVHFANGKVLYRDFIEWVDGKSYTVNVLNTQKVITAVVSFGVLQLTDGPTETSLMEISVTPVFSGFMPAIVHKIGWDMMMRHLTATYFESLLKGYEYHVTTGQKVRLNQFGRHILYS